MDIGQRTLFLAGTAVRIDQFYLVLLSTLLVVAGFLLLTVILGRVWCGWLCPQTVLNDLADFLRKRLHSVLPERAAGFVAHSLILLLAMLIALNLFCWFMAPMEALKSLVAFRDHPIMVSCFSILSLVLYLNLTVVKRSFCRSYCPYGRFQAALLDTGTLNLAFLEETSSRCIRCTACVKVCPMGIDIRQGFQIECINCGRCIDACRAVMERLDGSAGLISYRFGGAVDSGVRIGTKTVALSGVVCVLAAVLAWGIFFRSDTAFSVQRIATADSKNLADGSQVQAWRAIIGNRGQSMAHFAINLAPGLDPKMELLGPVTAIRIAPNENRQVSFFLRFTGTLPAHQPFELQLRKGGATVAAVKVIP